MADLKEAVESAVAHGFGECFWQEAAGEYRWLFRRDGTAMRVAVLWSIGVVTGWEHYFWAECDAAELGDAVRAAIVACDVHA